jgi:predicted DNA-binding protein (UPF0251 family)
MARPQNCRRIGYVPECDYFKPRGIPLSSLETIKLSLDEFEAIRLADSQGLYQENAAEKMNISRQTFGRILDSAHKKIADALVIGKALLIEGGEIKMTAKRVFACADCEHTWEVPFGGGRPQACPGCGSSNFHRSDSRRGGGWGRRGGGWQHGGRGNRQRQNR